ncbi:MAG TPA: hypothetical protein VFF73_13740 [Planctomycetota bacterium]|nr:hypothetical protein [Planctomycetota bacterium]
MTSPLQPPSLGDVLKKAGIVDAASLESLVLVLRDRLRSGTPASLGRLLLERGVPAPRILAAAASAGPPGAVRCDACSTVQPVQTRSGREFPCARCGALLLALGVPIATPSVPGAGPGETVLDMNVLPLPSPFTPGLQPEPNEDTTVPLDRDGTMKFGGVLPLPDAHESSSTTLPFRTVLPLPGRKPPVVVPGIPASELPTGIYSATDVEPLAQGIGIPPMVHTGNPVAPPAPGVPTTPPPVFGHDSASPTQADPDAVPLGAIIPPMAAGTRNTTAQGPGIPQRPPLRRGSARVAKAEGGGRRVGLVLVLAVMAVLSAVGLVVAVLLTRR